MSEKIERLTLAKAITRGLEDAMEADRTVVMLGEQKRLILESSNPATLMSSGTRYPLWIAAIIAVWAMESSFPKIPSIFIPLFSRCSTASSISSFEWQPLIMISDVAESPCASSASKKPRSLRSSGLLACPFLLIRSAKTICLQPQAIRCSVAFLAPW